MQHEPRQRLLVCWWAREGGEGALQCKMSQMVGGGGGEGGALQSKNCRNNAFWCVCVGEGGGRCSAG